MVSESELIGRLREFLRSSDLNTTTTATVRRQLEADFGIDLSDRKAFIREQVDLFLQSEHNHPQEQEQEEPQPADEDDEEEKDEETDKPERSRGSDSKGETEEEEDDDEDEEEQKSKNARNGKKNKGRRITPEVAF